MALSGGAWAQIHSKPPFPYRHRSFDLQLGGCGLVDEHPVGAGHCPQLGHDGCLKGDAFVESHLHVGLILIGAQAAADRLERDSDPGVFGGVLVIEVAGGEGGDRGS